MSVGRAARTLMTVAAVTTAATAMVARDAHAQLRPLDGPDWRLLSGSQAIAASIGVARLSEQRASLAGTTGTLWEIGTFSAAWRTGRVVLEAGGTARRSFTETGRFREAYPDVEQSPDGRRNDSGDFRISTIVRLTPARSAVMAALRFGTRLPTTDNTTGLDRDATDFFATIGARTSVAAVSVAADAGLGINTTREPRFEQEDVLLYSLQAEYAGYRVTPTFSIVGQKHGTAHAAIRGTENLGEIRLGLRAGSQYWVRLEIVRGYESFSPESGAMVTVGSTMNLATPGGR
ncbi:MAG: hypothetical protein ACR2GK_05010 [Gemmatimonadaceae bacterium]